MCKRINYTAEEFVQLYELAESISKEAKKTLIKELFEKVPNNILYELARRLTEMDNLKLVCVCVKTLIKRDDDCDKKIPVSLVIKIAKSEHYDMINKVTKHLTAASILFAIHVFTVQILCILLKTSKITN